jgi:Patatin-like phospholipase
MSEPIAEPGDCPTPPDSPPDVENLVGLALSGGGIRSASFNLGFLQGLNEQQALWTVDYLSTVSGGGFIGAWWSAWLSRAKRPLRQIFPLPEELESQRREQTAVLLGDQAQQAAAVAPPDGSLSAKREDPIHFVRLFSNYLTPKTGIMSPDTWRLIAYFVRSLLCTWAALLPLLFAAVLMAQSCYLFKQDTREAFLCPVAPYADVSAPTPALCPLKTDAAAYADSTMTRLTYLKTPALMVFAICATLSLVWLVESAASPRLAAFAVLVLAGAVWGVIGSGSDSGLMAGWWVPGAVAATLLFYGLRFFVPFIANWGRGVHAADASAADRRTWLTQQQAQVLKVGVFAAVLLLIAGFGHDIVWFLFSSAGSALQVALKRVGGWGALFLTVVSGLYTAIQKAPSTVGHTKGDAGTVGKILMAVAPPLVVLALVLVFALQAHQLLASTLAKPVSYFHGLARAVVWLAAVEVVFAMYESYEDRDTPAAQDAWSWRRLVPDFLLMGQRTVGPDGKPQPWYYLFSPRAWARLAVLICAGTVVRFADDPSVAGVRFAIRQAPTTAVGLVILLAVAAATLARLKWRVAIKSARPVVLLAGASMTATLCLLANGGLVSMLDESALMTALLWIAVLLGGVVALGWLADPNLISLHGFYKSRLARAYLGASNTARNNDEITDAVPGDDLGLKELWNHDVGGPYHLVNSALNLVGGSDLATSQRLAENFVMTRYHCGSARAGYRCTANYMSGELSLATAAAISGAAISPTMGSKSPSAALTLLLSLLNVRLGFWAPTPSGKRWYEPHARLWPFYVLQETLANTGRMAAYCYLTDGGHFDNTGLYALIERGCRYIVVCDCGADPLMGFEDVGNAIRRCRIDFGVEIDLTIDDFAVHTRNDGVGTTHVGRGTIRYQPEHLRMLGLEANTGATGTVLWIKPSVTALSAADVRQYLRANSDFPQQPTSEQWYDESQFESYRRLGYESALQAFAAGAVPGVSLTEGDFDSIPAWFDAYPV